MALISEAADATRGTELGLEPKSFAEAVEEALARDDPPLDESIIKESPPEHHSSFSRSTSEARPLGEVIDEIERSPAPGSPVLRHPRGRLENKSSHDSHMNSADKPVAMSNGTTNGHSDDHSNGAANGSSNDDTNGVAAPRTNGNTHKEKETGSDTVHEAGTDHRRSKNREELQEPRTPTRKAPSASSGQSLKVNKSQRTRPESIASGSLDATPEPGTLIYESLRNKSGENLASVKPPAAAYQLSLTSREDKADEAEKPSASKRPQRSRQLSLVSGRRAGAGWAASAIRWAPLNVPVQRRLQTLVVLLHTISIVGMLGIFFIICAIPLSWPIVVPYLIYLTFSRAAVDGKLAHRSEWLRSSKIWSLFGAYFPARLHRSQELEPTRKYIFGYHPHGIISHGAFAAFATEALGFGQLFPGITNSLLTLDANFSIPLYRDWAIRLGLQSVSRESCENLLSKGGINGAGMGRAITIVIGGARESLDASPKSLKLVLKKRKGFVKLAVRTGADLVPVLSFGENDLYDQVDGESHPIVHKFQLFVKKCMGFTVSRHNNFLPCSSTDTCLQVPLFHARGVFNYDVGIMPYRRPMNIVVGKPIPVRQAAQPDPAYVEELHAKYIEELVGIWETWKDDFAPNRVSELELAE
jgi:2-acylglycerol O-acyltransferase 2